MEILVVIFGVSSALAIIDFLFYLVNKERCLGNAILRMVEFFTIIVGPLLFLSDMDSGTFCEYCPEIAFFAPAHRLTIYVLILLSAAAYFYSSFRTKLAGPLLELIVNCFLLTGLALNIFISIHHDDNLWLVGNVPIIALFLTAVIKNHQLLFDETFSWKNESKNLNGKICRKILKSNFFIKYPLLLVLCLPLLLLLSSLLLLFGQQPDSAIKAFTDVYDGYGLFQALLLPMRE